MKYCNDSSTNVPEGKPVSNGEPNDEFNDAFNEETRNAVALHYDGQSAPRLTAKGQNELADEIVAIAEAFRVPTFQQSDLAQLLYNLDLNEEIPQTLYVTVAEILALAYRLEGRVPGDNKRPVRQATHPKTENESETRG